MAKLSHIDDVERRGQDAEAQQMLEAQQALVDARRAQQVAEEEAAQRAAEEAAQQAAAQQAARQQAARRQATAQQAAEEPRFERFEQAPAQQAASAQSAVNRTADEEADFHGLGQGGSMELGQKALIVLALVVVVVAGVYVLNTFFGWF